MLQLLGDRAAILRREGGHLLQELARAARPVRRGRVALEGVERDAAAGGQVLGGRPAGQVPGQGLQAIAPAAAQGDRGVRGERHGQRRGPEDGGGLRDDGGGVHRAGGVAAQLDAGVAEAVLRGDVDGRERATLAGRISRFQTVDRGWDAALGGPPRHCYAGYGTLTSTATARCWPHR